MLELIGLPSGQVLKIYSAFIQILYYQNLIMKNPKLGWTFRDDDENRIKMIMKSKNLNLI